MSKLFLDFRFLPDSCDELLFPSHIGHYLFVDSCSCFGTGNIWHVFPLLLRRLLKLFILFSEKPVVPLLGNLVSQLKSKNVNLFPKRWQIGNAVQVLREFALMLKNWSPEPFAPLSSNKFVNRWQRKNVKQKQFKTAKRFVKKYIQFINYYRK